MRVDEPMLLDSGDATQAGQPLRRTAANRPPSSLELVDLRDQRQDFGCDPKRDGSIPCVPAGDRFVASQQPSALDIAPQ